MVASVFLGVVTSIKIDSDFEFSGGSVANMYGMNVARYYQFPDIKTDGMYGLPRLIVLTSDHVRTTCEFQSLFCDKPRFLILISYLGGKLNLELTSRSGTHLPQQPDLRW